MRHLALFLFSCYPDRQRIAYEVSCPDIARQELYLAVTYADGSPTFKPMMTIINRLVCPDPMCPHPKFFSVLRSIK